MTGVLSKRIAAVVAVALLGVSLAGCTKCGWIWEDGAHACHSAAPR